MFALEFSQGIEDAWGDIASFVPKFLGFLAVLVIGWFVAKSIAKIANGALERVGFDKAVEQGGVKKALSKSKYDASDIVAKIVFYALFLFVLQFAFGLFGDNPVSDLISGVIAYLPKAFVAIVIIVLAAAGAAAVKTLLEGTLGGLSYGKAVANAASIGIVVFGVFAALDQLQVAEDIVRLTFTALMAIIAGVAIVAIGGGGIQPMRAQWEKALNKVEEEAPRMKEAAANRSNGSSTPTPAEDMDLRPTAQERLEARTQ